MNKLLHVFFLLIFLSACKDRVDEETKPLKLKEDFLIIGVDNDSFETRKFDPPLDINAPLEKANTLSDYERLIFGSDIKTIGIHAYNFWHFDSIWYKLDTMVDSSFHIHNVINSDVHLTGITSAAVREHIDTIYYRVNRGLDSMIIFNYSSGNNREIIDPLHDPRYETPGEQIQFETEVISFNKGDTIFLRDLTEMEFKIGGTLNKYLYGFPISGTSLSPKPEYQNELEKIHLPEKIEIVKEYWPIGTRKYIFIKDFFSAHSPEEVRYKYGWMEIEILDNTHVLVHSLGKMISNKGYYFDDYE